MSPKGVLIGSEQNIQTKQLYPEARRYTLPNSSKYRNESYWFIPEEAKDRENKGTVGSGRRRKDHKGAFRREFTLKLPRSPSPFPFPLTVAPPSAADSWVISQQRISMK
ncbi:hypothetical protein STEG23_011352 [Scotinomys teguina]